MTLEHADSSQISLMKISIAVAVAFGVLVWDYVTLLPEEVKLHQRPPKGLWRSPVTWAFVILRYSGILAVLPLLFLTSLETKHCQTAMLLSQMGVVLVVASSGIIFWFRVFAAWRGHNTMCAIVGLIFLIMLGCSCAVATQYHAVHGPPTPFGSSCQVLPVVSWATIGYSSSVAFDVAVLLFLIFDPNSHHGEGLNVERIIYHDTLRYFLITLVTNIAILVVQALSSNVALLLPATEAYSAVITATMGARVFLKLRLLDQRQTREESLPLTLPVKNRTTGSRNTFLEPPQPSLSVPSLQLPSNTYPINLDTLKGQRPDTPFASYDYDSPKTDIDEHFGTAHFTRETVVTVE